MYTGNTNKSIGNVLDVVWRKPAATAPATPTPMCIYGTKFTANGGAANEYNTTAGGASNFLKQMMLHVAVLLALVHHVMLQWHIQSKNVYRYL